MKHQQTFPSSYQALVALAALSVLAGPVSDWMAVTAAHLVDPAAYIDANRLGEGA